MADHVLDLSKTYDGRTQAIKAKEISIDGVVVGAIAPVTDTTTLDTTGYLSLTVDGVAYKLALASV